ncbi:hypothetical protein DDF62_25230 [Caulobacter radicis]|nr:hypothetical protein DDF62_25230 [Caulobacter radicis]
MSAARLADYMAASEQARRSIVQSCKYRPTVRVIQHVEARAAVTSALLSGSVDVSALKERANFIRSKIADSQFESDLNEHNADYVSRFADVVPVLDMPKADISAGKSFPDHSINGVRVTFQPDAMLQRITKTNKVRTGAVMLRYAKGKALNAKVASYQSAFIFGRMTELADLEIAEPEKKLCAILDAQSGVVHEAPGNANYLYKEMDAACLAIAERWEAIKPPVGAVVKGT